MRTSEGKEVKAKKTALISNFCFFLVNKKGNSQNL